MHQFYQNISYLSLHTTFMIYRGISFILRQNMHLGQLRSTMDLNDLFEETYIEFFPIWCRIFLRHNLYPQCLKLGIVI